MATTQEGFWKGAGAGFLGGACQTFVGQPFDTVKVRMQTAASAQPKFIECAAATLRREGLHGLYRGTTPAMMCGLVENTIAFGVNEQLKRYCLQHQVGKNKAGQLSKSVLAGCGAISGFAHCIISCPMEVVKCRLQALATSCGARSCTMDMLRNEGLSGVYSGFWPFVGSIVPFYLMFFLSYEVFACQLQCRGAPDKKPKRREDLSAFQLIMCGGLAGCIGWTFVMPFDVVKTKMQTNEVRSTISETCREVYRTRGLLGFFGGWSAAMLRAFPSNAALLASFELSRRVLSNSPNIEVSLSMPDECEQPVEAPQQHPHEQSLVATC
eukprot:gnl/TRDRNA2_/TRDRNA2_191964_c0_seq1.p1 gnl/TRDRNA2_/TRDRNA2_191964_c0~~gnl/TRDRNA2_/TRDRNA2_191964_c0_seq1.p1  ORF type:complete len:336 (+),score=47.11 gnl/TRDRNA2_/TRDRNA2_191964_c0_seq1:36-1010(+)